MTADSDSTPTKTCTKCGQRKGSELFSRQAAAMDGLQGWCKLCVKSCNAARYASNPEKFKKQAADWSLKNRRPGHNHSVNSSWSAERRAAANEYGRAHYAANKQRYLDNNERRRVDRIKSDPVYAMSRRIRGLILGAFRSNGYTKKSKAQDILGCDWQEFKTHIERQFLKGMTWDNRGEWHLDHIQPIASAKTEADLLALNHFTNVRPLWASENIAKKDKITHLI